MLFSSSSCLEILFLVRRSFCFASLQLGSAHIVFEMVEQKAMARSDQRMMAAEKNCIVLVGTPQARLLAVATFKWCNPPLLVTFTTCLRHSLAAAAAYSLGDVE